MSDDWQKVKQIFNAALEHDPGRRADYLDRACDRDAQLRSEVEKLLSGYESDFMERPVVGIVTEEGGVAVGEVGRHYLAKFDEADTARAIDYFKKAIEIDPNFAEPYAGLAGAWLNRGIWGETGTLGEFEAEVREAATTAIRIDPDNAYAHVAMVQLLNNYDYDWSGAESEARRALEIDPNNVDALEFYAWLLQSWGRHDEARSLMERAEQLDPVSSRIQSSFGRMRYRARDYPAAQTHLLRAIELDPGNYAAYGRLGDVYIEMGRFNDAIAQFEKSQSIQPQGVHALRLAVTFARMGDRRRAMEVLEKVTTRTPWELARLYTALGETDKAIALLDRTITDHDRLLVHLKEDPSFDPLHTDPRWPVLLRRLKFPGV